MRENARKSRHHSSPALPLFLVGGGLLILGVVSGLWLLETRGETNPFEADLRSGELAYSAPAKVDFPAPALSLYNLRGEMVSLADYHDKVVLINNWATWCPPCKAEMPVLQAFYNAYSGRGLTVLAIESGEPPAEVAAFVDEHGLTFPVLPDPTGSATQAFNNYSLPSTYAIDQKGQVRLVWMGPVTRSGLEKYVLPLLEE